MRWAKRWKAGVGVLASTISAIAVGGPSTGTDVSAVANKLSNIKILFGHQSVGGNLLQGLEEVSGARIHVHPLATPVSDLSTAVGSAGLSLGINHFFVGSNEAP